MAEPEHLGAVQDCLPVEETARIEFRAAVIPPRRLRPFGVRFRLDWALQREVWREAKARHAEAVS